MDKTYRRLTGYHSVTGIVIHTNLYASAGTGTGEHVANMTHGFSLPMRSISMVFRTTGDKTIYDLPTLKNATGKSIAICLDSKSAIQVIGE